MQHVESDFSVDVNMRIRHSYTLYLQVYISFENLAPLCS